MSKHVVARVGDLADKSRLIIRVKGREIGIFRVGSRYYAMRNHCPHQGGPVCLGQQFAGLTSTKPGEYDLDDSRSIVRCPWHQWEFDLETGQSWFDPDRVRTKAYAASVESGNALLNENADVTLIEGSPAALTAELSAQDAGRGAMPGPYIAETYPISVLDDYIVVEIGR